MKLELVRQKSTTKSTSGKLYIDGVFSCYTLEDVVREILGRPVSEWKIPKQTAISYGTYPVVIDFSQRFQRPMPHILSVPGFDGIRIHSGNTDADVEGCILVGNQPGEDRVNESRAAFNSLFVTLSAAANRGESITITITPS